MKQARSLVCLTPEDPPRLSVRDMPLRPPGRGELVVEQLASAINPIDVKRAGGYGRRLLSLRGAGHFPLVLGNDVVGIVRDHGPDVSTPPLGAMVVGISPTGRYGAHASHVVIPARHVRPVPPGTDLMELAALPYCFTTMWIALRAAGLRPVTAAGRKVLVNGASGALGRMALHVLRTWGALTTAVASAAHLPACKELGADELVPRGNGALGQLPSDFAAVLNFGSWADDAQLSARLADHAFGHSTTVHPLLANFDSHGWLGGARHSYSTRRASRAQVAARSTSARYAWVLFQPDEEALEALLAAFAAGLRLPVGWTGTPDDAASGFERVRAGAQGRSVLVFPPP
ncbi:zinc-binding alcohol dehydrogenase [Variovorax sp. LjRoot290]|uniref:alcohol dehydrogenase catalytic domain-containing protein n=1 Tax=unclassified Variovorax TaxID=663243 RepID=UPI003ECDD4C6